MSAWIGLGALVVAKVTGVWCHDGMMPCADRSAAHGREVVGYQQRLRLFPAFPN